MDSLLAEIPAAPAIAGWERLGACFYLAPFCTAIATLGCCRNTFARVFLRACATLLYLFGSSAGVAYVFRINQECEGIHAN
jgi:hypothetical protein